MTTIRMICLVIVATSVIACSSSKDLKAPCGPLTLYVDADDACGPLKPINAAPFDAIMEISA